MFCFLSIMEMLAAFSFEASLALAFWRETRLGHKALDITLLFCIFILFQSCHVMTFGILGLLNGFWLGVSSCAGLAACALFPRFRARIVASFKILLSCLCDIIRAARRNPVLTACFIAVSAYIILHAVMFVVLAPPLSFDALTYHLSKVAQWIHTGSLYLPDLPIKRVFWPSGMELLNCWWAVFFHNEVLIELPGLYFHALATLAIYVLARNMGIGCRSSAYAAILFSITPSVVGHGSSCLTDLPTAAFFFVLLALWTKPFDDEEKILRRWMATIMVLCLAIGVKPTIVFMLPGLAIAAIPSATGKDFIKVQRVFHASATLWILLSCAVFVSSFWYLRNTVRFGNPLYPVEIGNSSIDGIQSGIFSFRNLCSALKILFVEKGILDGGWITPNLYRMTGWGWFAVACGIPCSFFSAFKSRRFALLFIGQLVAATSILGTVLADSSCLRLLLWMPGPLAIGFAHAISTKGHLPRLFSIGLIIVAAISSCLNLVTGLANAQRIDWPHQLFAIGKRPGINGYWQSCLSSIVPETENIAVFMYREGPLYLAYGPHFKRGVVTIPAADAEIDFAKALDCAKLRFLFYPEWKVLFPKASESLRRQLDSGLMINIKDCIFMRTQCNADANGGNER